MTDSITNSNELRQFAAENSGRRKIDVDESLELHLRAANQIDLLQEHIDELRVRMASQPKASPASTVEDPAQAALLMLQNAQTTATQTITEAESIRADAERTKADADAIAQARVDSALEDARDQATHIIEAAETRAAEVAAATASAADRAAYAQRKYRERAQALRAEAEAVVNLAHGMESLAEEEPAPALTSQPFTEPVTAPPETAAPSTPPPVEAQPVTAPAETAAPSAPPPVEAQPAQMEHSAAAPPPPPAPAPAPAPAGAAEADDDERPGSEFRPPPPPDSELIDLTESELEDALGGQSIDDELFGEDAVIDLTDEPAPSSSSGFEFFSRD